MLWLDGVYVRSSHLFPRHGGSEPSSLLPTREQSIETLLLFFSLLPPHA